MVVIAAAVVDLTHTVQQVRVEVGQRRRIVLEALAEGLEHRRWDVQEPLAGVVRQHRAARA